MCQRRASSSAFMIRLLSRQLEEDLQSCKSIPIGMMHHPPSSAITIQHPRKGGVQKKKTYVRNCSLY
jgi:hypothetical protein